MIEEIILPESIFEKSMIDGFKQKNFIYGKNGTGKSTITKKIIEQYSDTFDVRVFQGYESVVENNKLNAISLGEENAQIQNQINEIDNKIENLKALIEDRGTDNLFEKQKKVQITKQIVVKKRDDFLRNAAKSLKTNHSVIVGPNYNYRNFENDIPNRKSISEVEEKELRKLLYEDKLPIIKCSLINLTDLNLLIAETNNILSTNLTKKIIISFESSEQENWVKNGIHLHIGGGKCAFCGNDISEERLIDLNNYFDDKVKKFELNINLLIDKINSEKSKVEKIERFDSSKFYYQFHNELTAINLELSEKKGEIIKLLDKLKEQLEIRKDNVFIIQSLITVSMEGSLHNIFEKYNILCKRNNEITNNIENQKIEAVNKLKYHLVAIEIEKSEYFQLCQEENSLSKEYSSIKDKIREVKENIDKLIVQRNNYVAQTINEERAATEISNYLANIGENSFRLVLVDGNQEGQYYIENLDGTRRDVSTLSTGEKNIISFLWFYFDLTNPKKLKDKNRIIVFDDPMNSNDDTMQYLIITLLQKLLRNINNSEQIFILTHNIHFYVNVRYLWWRDNGKNKRTIHLIKRNGKTVINIIDKKENDIETTYESLWKELKWKFDSNKPEYMANTIRRIFETYQKFHKVTNEDFFGEFLEFRKYLDVNSHALNDIEDISTEPNTKSCDEIIDLVKIIFENNGDKKHFDSYWGTE